MSRESSSTLGSSMRAMWLLSAALASLSVVTGQEVDYTCNAVRDYQNPKIPGDCPVEKIQNGVCDNPNHGGEDDSCLEQDCIDCNEFCQQFNADCFGCLNAKGCFYCPGDATCQNSDLYQSAVKQLSCTTPGDYWLGGREDPNELCIPDGSLTNDPLSLTNNWMYKMINIDQVWNDGFTGNGISIRINDLGVSPDNLDFDGRFDQENSCPNFEPLPIDTDGTLDDHGTRVAGIAIANANNEHCAAGIAYGATFTSCNVLALSYQQFNTNIETIDISQNAISVPACEPGTQTTPLEECPFKATAESSFDPCNSDVCDYANTGTTSLSQACEDTIFRYCTFNFKEDEDACLDFLDILLAGSECDYDKIPKSAIDALREGVTQGRDGKGIVYVFASGNSFYRGEDVNFSKWSNSRYTITVGAVGKDGLHADYSTGGAALHVVAPAGDSDDASHILTTGLDNTCRNAGFGTSFSSPVASGVVAMMLEARPELTWRDVQGILVDTSTVQTDPLDDTVTTNAAGKTHSNWYGFGLIDAKKAVDLAKTWPLLTPEYQALGQSAEENQPIPNDGTEYRSQLTMSTDYTGFAAESTTVMLNLQHYNRGDLELTLVSPSGTESVLHPGRRPERGQLVGDERWKLSTVRNWGEDPTGTWTLKIKDLETNNTVTNGANELRQWKLIVYGRTPDGEPPVLTVESESPSGSPTLAPTVTNATAAPTVTNATTAPTVTSDDTSDDTNATSPTDSPTVSPTGSPSFSPTQAPTLTPGRLTLAPFLMVRPTALTRGAPSQQPVSFTGGEARGPPPANIPGGTLPQTAIQTQIVPPGIGDAVQGVVNRPVVVVTQVSTQQGDPRAALLANFQRFGDDESENESSQEFLTVELVSNLSLVFWGISEDIPKEQWEPIRIALQEHIIAVVEKKMPELHFWAELQIASVAVNEPVPHWQRRNLRPEENLISSVTISYDVLVHFDHLPGEEGLKATTLAALPFEAQEDRDAFVRKIHDPHHQLDQQSPSLKHLEMISDLSLYPTEVAETMPIQQHDSVSTVIAWSVSVCLLCATLAVVFLRRRKLEQGKQAHELSSTL